MHLLLIAATTFEVLPLQQWLSAHFDTPTAGTYVHKTQALTVDLLISGVGSTATAWHLGHRLARVSYNWVLNAGIAGSFDPAFAPGAVVQVVSEQFGDLGIEEAEGDFRSLFDLGLVGSNEPPFQEGLLLNPSALEAVFLPQAQGLTVQKVHGFEPSIEAIRRTFPTVQVESMEGAAVFYSCLMANVPFAQIRSISNIVEKRDRSRWQIPLAIDALNTVLIEIVETMAFNA